MLFYKSFVYQVPELYKRHHVSCTVIWHPNHTLLRSTYADATVTHKIILQYFKITKLKINVITNIWWESYRILILWFQITWRHGIQNSHDLLQWHSLFVTTIATSYKFRTQIRQKQQTMADWSRLRQLYSTVHRECRVKFIKKYFVLVWSS